MKNRQSTLKGTFVVIVTLLFMAISGFGHDCFQTNINFAMGYPQGEFRDNVPGSATGGSGYLLYRLRHSPVLVGLSLGILTYGRETREDLLNVYVPEVLVDVRTTNNILNAHFMIRLQPRSGPVRPYVDGLVGLSHFWTETGIYDQEGSDEDCKIADTVHWSDTALSYGGGVGLMVRVLGIRHKGRILPGGIFLDLGIRFIKSGRAEYMTEGDLVRVDDSLEYYVRESNTDHLTAFIGLNFVF